MWIFSFHTLVTAAEAFVSFYKFPEMRLGYSNLALVAVTLLSTSQAQCPDYTGYSQVLVWYFGSMIELKYT